MSILSNFLQIIINLLKQKDSTSSTPEYKNPSKGKLSISQAGISYIKKAEGCRLNAYLDIAGVWTIGVGHTEGVEKDDKITQEQADRLLILDLKIFEKAVNSAVTVPLSQSQYDALCSFTFNLGGTALRRSTLLKKLNNKDYNGAAEEFLRWCKAKDPKTGKLKTSKGLLKRRKEEREIFLS